MNTARQNPDTLITDLHKPLEHLLVTLEGIADLQHRLDTGTRSPGEPPPSDPEVERAELRDTLAGLVEVEPRIRAAVLRAEQALARYIGAIPPDRL
jgi:hypothetical protein